jgi:hypothetical protein
MEAGKQYREVYYTDVLARYPGLMEGEQKYLKCHA